MPNVAATISLNVPAITALCKGDPGTSILHGLFAPTLAVGNLGDFYLDTYAYVLYGPKSATDWGVATILTNSISAGIWNDSYTYLYSNTGNITSSISTLSSLSSKWSSSYNTVYGLSSNWINGNPAFNVISPLSANLISLYNTVTANSGAWNAGGSYAHPSDWNSTHDTVFQLSGVWGTTPSVASTVITMTATSGKWSAAYTTLSALSSQWQWSVQQLNTYENAWNQAVASISTDVSPNSSDWESTHDTVYSLSGNWSSVFTSVNGASASWNTGGGTNAPLTLVRNNSGYWNNTYVSMDTNVSPNTAHWQSSYGQLVSLSSYWNDAANNVNGSPAGGWPAWDNAWTALTYIQPTFNAMSGSFVSFSGAWISTYNSMTALSGRVQVLENATIIGKDPYMGLSAMSSGTVTVTNSNVAANSRIFLTIQDPNGTASPGNVWVQSRTPGTSFVIKSSNASDTSKVAWLIAVPL